MEMAKRNVEKEGWVLYNQNKAAAKLQAVLDSERRKMI